MSVCSLAWGCTGNLGGTLGSSGSAGASAGGTGASGGAAGTAGGPAAGDLPCDVQAMLRDNCVSCHSDSPQRIAPMALLTRADLLAPSKTDPSKTTGQRALERLGATTNFMPPSGRLSDATIAPFATWVQDGMPAGTCDTGITTTSERVFEPLSADAALDKVKTFLTGRAPDETEYTAYRSNAAALTNLIDQWLATPEFAARALDLLRLLFQQRSDGDDLGQYLRFGDNNNLKNIQTKGGIPFSDYIERSFALTAWNIVQQGRPFTNVVTTRSYMLNLPLMALLARIDARPSDDLNQRQRGFIETLYPNLSLSYVFDRTIPWTDTINPASPDFMHVSVAQAANGDASQCADALTKTYPGGQAVDQIWQTLLRVPGRETCWSNPSPLPQTFTDADKAFRPITIRLAKPGETHTLFWDLDALRKTSELVLGVEYVGFFGSLGFLGYWTTNDSNEYRVTTNQALIVALGQTFTSDSTSVVADTSGVDQAHAAPGTVCYGCHRTLDPMRDFMRESYTYWGSPRTTSKNNESVAPIASFTVDGSSAVTGTGVGALAQAMATHPDFAKAWARKLCGLVNARGCSADDPELARVAGVFQSSNYDFKSLLRAVLSSPIVTYQQRTKTWDDNGATAGVALRDDLCRRLEIRLGIMDACAARGQIDAPASFAGEIRGYVGSLPTIAYARGDVDPQIPIDPNPFSTAAAERFCERLADRFLGSGTSSVATPIFSATNRAGAIDAFLIKLMGVSASDPRAADLRAVLNDHWDAVLAQHQSATVALQSTFVLACTSPLTTSIGL